jgi:hypothetical protein
MRHRERMMVVVVALAVLAVTGCGRSPAAKADEARATLRSWDSTLALTEREHVRGAIPADFAAQVRRAADAERGKAEAQLQAADSR